MQKQTIMSPGVSDFAKSDRVSFFLGGYAGVLGGRQSCVLFKDRVEICAALESETFGQGLHRHPLECCWVRQPPAGLLDAEVGQQSFE